MFFEVSTKVFSICSSLFIQFAHTNAHVLEMMMEDGSPWFSLQLYTMFREQYLSEIHNTSEKVQFWYRDPRSDEALPLAIKTLPLLFADTGLTIVPHSWSEPSTKFRET